MTVENIYGLYHGPANQPVFFYVGVTTRTIEERLTEHKKGVASDSSKPAWEYARHLDDWHIMELDTTESGLTERDYVTALILEGHPLQNATEGNRKVAKKRTVDTFRTINREALARTSSERRNRLHNHAQNLSKPEIVRSRITGAIPCAEEINELNWVYAAIEQLPMRKPPKDPAAITVELCKVGDYNIYVGFRKNQAIDWIFNTRTQCGAGTHASFYKATGKTRLDILKQIERNWDRIVWYPKYSGDL